MALSVNSPVSRRAPSPPPLGNAVLLEYGWIGFVLPAPSQRPSLCRLRLNRSQSVNTSANLYRPRLICWPAPSYHYGDWPKYRGRGQTLAVSPNRCASHHSAGPIAWSFRPTYSTRETKSRINLCSIAPCIVCYLLLRDLKIGYKCTQTHLLNKLNCHKRANVTRHEADFWADGIWTCCRSYMSTAGPWPARGPRGVFKWQLNAHQGHREPIAGL